jgi:galactitol-specific phosphotransferase system IIB component
MHSLTDIFVQISFHWWIVLISCTVGLTGAVCTRALQTEEARARHTERNKEKELRSLAERISVYAHSVHQRYPTGDVVVSERDLAERLRKRPDAVVTALNLLLNEQKIQKAPLNGYWKFEHMSDQV